MLRIYNHPPRNEWPRLCERPALETASLEERIKEIFERVAQEGDAALAAYNKAFDQVSLEQLFLDKEAIAEHAQSLDFELQKAIKQAYDNIKQFHEAQAPPLPVVEPYPGISCWTERRGMDAVGLYIPGGTAPLFSTVLMLGIPAQIANCPQRVLCTPPKAEGNIHPAICFAAQLCGIERIYLVGGAQAIAAMALGTESIPKVVKIFGPGNQYVTAAKRYAERLGVALDMPAGPSEVLVLADAVANADFIAADLLSQAEHGADSQVILVSTDKELCGKVNTALEAQLKELPRAELAQKALDNSRAIVLPDLEQAMDFVNAYAPEHFILQSQDNNKCMQLLRNAGSVFLGPYSPESVGDYASGTNHTLPTAGFAKQYSGVSVESFSKRITVQELSYQGLKSLKKTVVTMARAEELEAHAQAVLRRLETS